MSGGKWEFTNNEEHKKFIKDFYNNSKSNNYNYRCLCAKSCDTNSHRLWFDCDSSEEPTEKILHNINMILVENLIEPNTRSLITMNIEKKHKRHIKYPDIYVNNSIRKALVQKINEKFGSDYVDEKANTGLRLELTNKYDKKNEKWVKNSRYVKENGEDLNLDELLGDYNILKEGEIIGIQKDLIKEVQKKQKQSKCKNINTNDLPEWVKSQIEKIKQNDRFKNMIAEGRMLNDMYVLNLCQGFVCPFVNRAHTSNRNKIEIYQNRCSLGCHKCNKRETLFLDCLIDIDDDEDDKFFDIDTFLGIDLNGEEKESLKMKQLEIVKKELDELESEKEDLENETDIIEEGLSTCEDDLETLEDNDIDEMTKKQIQDHKKNIKSKKKILKKITTSLRKMKKKLRDKITSIKDKEREMRILEKESKKDLEVVETINYKELMKSRIPYFEKFHCKILSPFCYIEKRRNQVNIYNHNPFIQKNQNLMEGDFIKEWLDQSHIRSYDRMDFLPFPLEQPEGVYNTYTGLRIDNIKSYKETDFSRITDHIKLMVGVDEETEKGYNQKGYNYMLDYLSHMVQRVGELPRVALLFKGQQGTGKNIFWNNFGNKVLGNQYVLETAEIEKVIGRFNSLNQKFVVILDETTGKDSFQNSDKIKNIITQDTIAWEQKGIQTITINNCGRYIFLTNNDTPIKIEMTDRRFVVFEMNPEKRNNADYFKALVNDFNNDDVVMSFVNFLKNRDISKWNSIGERPITKAYEEIQSVNIPIYARFLIDWSMKNNENMEYSASSLFKKFNNFLERGNYDMKITISSFCRYIKKYKGIIFKKKSFSNVYYFNSKRIREGLIEKNFMEKSKVSDYDELLIDE